MLVSSGANAHDIHFTRREKPEYVIIYSIISKTKLEH